MPGLMLTDDLEQFRATIEEYSRTEIAPVIADLYETGEFPLSLIQGLADLGLFGLPFPEEVGGGGGDLMAFGVALEELARVDSSVAITVEAAVSLGATPIHRFGSDEQKQQWLPDLLAGRALGAFGLTEPGGGSDAGAARTTAVEQGDQWVLNGEKSFITNSGTTLTAFVTVAARTGATSDERSEISTIIVPSGTPGLEVGGEYSKVGWRCSDTRPVGLVDCAVPKQQPVGYPWPRVCPVPVDT